MHNTKTTEAGGHTVLQALLQVKSLLHSSKLKYKHNNYNWESLN